MHHLIVIKPVQLRCPRCGAQATVGAGRSRVTVTGRQSNGRLLACQDCLAYWLTSHRCQQRVAA